MVDNIWTVKEKKYFKWATFLFALLALLPFIYLFTLAYPVSDDIGRAAKDASRYFYVVQGWLQYHNGRYFNALLCSLPVYNNIVVYQLCNVLFSLFFLWTCYYLFKKLGYSAAWLMGLFFFTFAFLYLPNHNQYYYWYATQTAYVFSFSIYLILLAVLHQIYTNNQLFNRQCWIIVLLLFIGIGSHELLIGPALIMIASLSAFQIWRNNGQDWWKYLLLNICGLANAIAVVLIPGSTNRQTIFEKNANKDIFFSIQTSFTGTWDFIIENIFTTSAIIYLLALFLLSITLNKVKYKINGAYILILSVLTFLVLWSIFFIYCYSTGQVQFSVNRIYDLLFSYTFIHFSLIVVALGQIFNTQRSEFFNSKNIRLGTLFIYTLALIFLFLNSENLKIFQKEYSNGLYGKYKKEIHNRWQLINDSNAINKKLILPPIIHCPELIYFKHDVGIIGVKTKDSRHNNIPKVFFNEKFKGKEELLLRAYNSRSSQVIKEGDKYKIYHNEQEHLLLLQVNKFYFDKNKMTISFLKNQSIVEQRKIIRKDNCFNTGGVIFCIYEEYPSFDEIDIVVKPSKK